MRSNFLIISSITQQEAALGRGYHDASKILKKEEVKHIENNIRMNCYCLNFI